MQTFKVDFSYTDEGFILLRAENPQDASVMANELLSELKSAVVEGVREISTEEVEALVRKHTQEVEEGQEAQIETGKGTQYVN